TKSLDHEITKFRNNRRRAAGTKWLWAGTTFLMASPLWLGSLGGLQLFSFLQFAFRIGGASQTTIRFAHQMMGNVVRRIHAQRLLQVSGCRGKILLLDQHLAHQDIRPGSSGVEQDGALQGTLRVVIPAKA